jgi:hypothetical protein
MRRLVIGSAILGMTLLNFFQFPGHTWLQSDTQIYVPIMEHMWDPSVLNKDLIVQHPHVAFTIYDEIGLGLRKVTALDFRHVLQAEQFVLRTLAIWGVFLIAAALGLSDALALLAAAVFSLGATLIGPAVLVFEYEPVPRGFAISLIFLAIGLIAHDRYVAAGIAASAASLFHAPTVAPFWAVYFCLALWPSTPVPRRRLLSATGLLALAALLLLAASRYQASTGETQAFFTRLDPAQEELQRMRASYNWVSIWWKQWLRHYAILYCVTVLAYWRIRKYVPRGLRFFLIGLPLIGMVSIPVSYLLLEKMRWALIPQIQPTRSLLFVTAFAMLLGAVAACRAIESKGYLEAFAWLVVAYLPPVNRLVDQWPSWNRVGVVLALAALAWLAIRLSHLQPRWSYATLAAALIAPFFLIPGWGQMRNYATLHTPELAQLSAWGRTNTPQQAVFLFPDAEQELHPGVFRAEALRAVYVDWKAGGQVNFFKGLGEEWWSRWQRTMAAPFDPSRLTGYRELGIDYVVLRAQNRMAALTPRFQNSAFVVYEIGGSPMAALNVFTQGASGSRQ